MIYLTGVVENGFHIQLGDLLSVLAAVALSFQIVYYGNVATGARPQIVAFMLGITQAVISSTYSLVFERDVFRLINWSQAILPVIILGVTASFAAQTLQITCQKYTDTVTTGLILVTESLFASLVSVLFGIEQLTKRLTIGGTLIILALVVIQFNMGWLKNISNHKRMEKER